MDTQISHTASDLLSIYRSRLREYSYQTLNGNAESISRAEDKFQETADTLVNYISMLEKQAVGKISQRQ